jgi:rare lipoprotein A
MVIRPDWLLITEFHGRPTSSGEIFDMNGMTAAHQTLPLGTIIRVTHLGNHKSVVVKVNDRGPFVGDRILDLSYEAARKLGMIQEGVARVRIDILEMGEDNGQ